MPWMPVPPPRRGRLCALGQPWEQIPVGGPHAEVGLKPQPSPRGQRTKEEKLKSLLTVAQTVDCHTHNWFCKLSTYSTSENTTSPPAAKMDLSSCRLCGHSQLVRVSRPDVSFRSLPPAGASKDHSSRILYPRPKSLLPKMMNADMDAVDAENQVELEEKTRLINQVLELQHTLEDLSARVDAVKEENLKLKSENQVLGQYIENLMSASSVFQTTDTKSKRK
ncbi:short coiled-coil protein-like [Mesoplodon densirostris]|uniref:short coiled-coil protein-like n=1 Tax=Mesoplodon densirostris TaxID=48708 RepID=UPI0028DC1B2E|nr:short coiled-coil protein-like [Mesoplodon densirostris]